MASKEKKIDINRVLNTNLGGTLGRFQDSYTLSRAKAYEGINIEELRNKVADLKAYAADHMEDLAAQFTKNAESRGAKVFLAKTGEDVKKYILDLAKQKGAKNIIKSKSMASEEIHLNSHLEKAGLQVKETDLGEWIIQLAGQKPSHMVMPAIHLTKEEVADLFSKEVEERLTTDIPRLVKVARKELRKYFLEGDIGISGGNMAVAETGTLVLVTNEGNARLVTSLPPVHIAIVGLEKLVAKFSDVADVLKALPRSATGQQLTSYVTMVTGVTPTIVDGQEQPKELHIILMDNGRTEMRNDPKFKQALQCIRCASCLNVCPVYGVVGGHVFGDVYSGGIGTILTAWFDELKKSEDIQALCIQCGKCKEVCPGKIDIPSLILELRTRIAKKEGIGFTQKMIFEGVLSNRKLFHSLLRAASVGQKPFVSGNKIRHLPLFFSGLADFRSLPAIAATPLRDRFGKIKQVVKGGTKKKAVFYSGCLIDFAYPELGEDVIEVLNSEGIEVAFPMEQTCCGAPAKYSGAEDVALKLAKQNIEALEKAQGDYIVSACPTCTGALKHDFPKLLANEPEWLARAQKIADKAIDFSLLIHQIRKEKGTLLSAKGGVKVTYHDSCHLKRSMGIFAEPRELLNATSGIEIVEMKDSDVCCGMGGSYTVKLPEISKPILNRKVNNIKESKAEVVAMDCPGCLMQISGGLDKYNSNIKVKHTATILAEELRKNK